MRAGSELVVTPDNRTVYALGADGVQALDTASSTPSTLIPVPAGARKLAITPDGATVLVTSERANAVVPIVTATNRAGAPISLSGPTDAIRRRSRLWQ